MCCGQIHEIVVDISPGYRMDIYINTKGYTKNVEYCPCYVYNDNYSWIFTFYLHSNESIGFMILFLGEIIIFIEGNLEKMSKMDFCVRLSSIHELLSNDTKGLWLDTIYEALEIREKIILLLHTNLESLLANT
jgi:hypothetical protein